MSKGACGQAGAWRERLCFAADGAISYVSEKEAGKVAIVSKLFVNVTSLLRVNVTCRASLPVHFVWSGASLPCA